MMFDNREPDLYALGMLVREHRNRAGLTQSQLAERLGWVQERISLVENGKYGLPSLPALARLARALELPLSCILRAIGYADEAATTIGEAGPDADTVGARLYMLERLLTVDAVSLRDAMNQIADLLAGPMGADKIDAFMYEQGSATLVAVGTSETEMGRRQHRLGLDRISVVEGGRIAQVFATGEAFVTGRSDEDPDELPGFKEELGVRSSLNVPLIVDGQRRGVLTAASAHPDKWAGEDVRFFAAVAGWVGLIAHRAELTEQLTRLGIAE